MARGQAAISGGALRPFPAIMPGDYSWCRAAAWLEALYAAQKLLPPSALARLKGLSLDDPLGRMALCALACPVYMTTPESSSSTEIRVYLKSASEESFRRALDSPEALALEAYLISDVARRVNYLARKWPQSLAEAREQRGSLERQFASLDALWETVAAAPGERARGLSDTELAREAELLGDSAPYWLWLAEARERAGLPQGALDAADLALKHGAADSSRSAWLAAQIYYARALAHWRLSQPALAEDDLETAGRLLAAEGARGELAARIYLKLGDFCAARGDAGGMCRAYENACASGECRKLAAARREGKCGGESAGREP